MLRWNSVDSFPSPQGAFAAIWAWSDTNHSLQTVFAITFATHRRLWRHRPVCRCAVVPHRQALASSRQTLGRLRITARNRKRKSFGCSMIRPVECSGLNDYAGERFCAVRACSAIGQAEKLWKSVLLTLAKALTIMQFKVALPFLRVTWAFAGPAEGRVPCGVARGLAKNPPGVERVLSSRSAVSL